MMKSPVDQGTARHCPDFTHTAVPPIPGAVCSATFDNIPQEFPGLLLNGGSAVHLTELTDQSRCPQAAMQM